MLEHTYKSMNEKLTPSPALVSTTLQKMEERRSARRPVRLRRVMIAATALVLTMALSVGAMAAAIPGFRAMLFGGNDPRFAGLSEIVATGEGNGIELEVLGAMGNEKGFTAYFTLRDTTGKGRITEQSRTVSVDVQLNEEYPPDDLLNTIYGGMSERVTAVAFDEETGTMLYRYTFLTGDPNADDWFQGIRSGETYHAENAAVSFRLKRVITTSRDCEMIPLDLGQFEKDDGTTPITQAYALSPNGESDLVSLEEYLTREEGWESDFEAGGGTPRREMIQYQYDETGNAVVLTPQKPITVGGVEYAQITAVGFIDQKLHIQVLQPKFDASGWAPHSFEIYCTDRGAGAPDLDETYRYLSGSIDGDEEKTYRLLNPSFTAFSIGEDGTALWGSQNGYTEYVFDISPEELDRYDFYLSAYSFEADAPNITANFDLAESLPAEQREFGAVSADGIAIDSLTANAIGVAVSGSREGLRGLKSMTLITPSAEYPLDLLLSHPESLFSSEDDEALTLTLTSAGAPIPVAELSAVEVNGSRVELK